MELERNSFTQKQIFKNMYLNKCNEFYLAVNKESPQEIQLNKRGSLVKLPFSICQVKLR